jgi:hypothetical protein
MPPNAVWIRSVAWLDEATMVAAPSTAAASRLDRNAGRHAVRFDQHPAMAVTG